ncbi:hypothetical protein Skr01_31800 [Sphaerisporangium krabiense]|nr:hypothetical protein Skr01_31800 [Sphaerisporangium krabiense]
MAVVHRLAWLWQNYPQNVVREPFSLVVRGILVVRDGPRRRAATAAMRLMGGPMNRWIRAFVRLTPAMWWGERARAVRRRLRRWSGRFRAEGRRLVTIVRTRPEAGMSTAEYAVGTIAACAFAGLLFKIVSSEEVRKMLSDVIGRALQLAG